MIEDLEIKQLFDDIVREAEINPPNLDWDDVIVRSTSPLLLKRSTFSQKHKYISIAASIFVILAISSAVFFSLRTTGPQYDNINTTDTKQPHDTVETSTTTSTTTTSTTLSRSTTTTSTKTSTTTSTSTTASAPKNVKVSGYSTSWAGIVTITWESDGKNVAYFQVYKDGIHADCSSDANLRSCEFSTNASPGYEHTFYVTAFDHNDVESPRSNVATFTFPP